MIIDTAFQITDYFSIYSSTITTHGTTPVTHTSSMVVSSSSVTINIKNSALPSQSILTRSIGFSPSTATGFLYSIHHKSSSRFQILGVTQESGMTSEPHCYLKPFGACELIRIFVCKGRTELIVLKIFGDTHKI